MKRRYLNPYAKTLVCFLLFFLLFFSSNSQCNQEYAWTKWTQFSDTVATGTISLDSQAVSVTMSSNFRFTSTPGIYNYGAFSRFKDIIPDSMVPATAWSADAGGRTTMCFSRLVYNPVLLLASLGQAGIRVTLNFSRKYVTIYDGGGMSFINDSAITGFEGYAIIVFPGQFDCVTINSTTPEYYTNISWGLNPPLFSVNVTKQSATCNSVTYKATGGNIYKWSGGDNPDSSVNTFSSGGTYFLTVTGTNGCKVLTSVAVVLKPKINVDVSDSILEGESYSGHTSGGIYVDTLKTREGCDSIRKLTLMVKQKPSSKKGDLFIYLSALFGVAFLIILILVRRRRRDKKTTEDGNKNLSKS